MKAYATEVKLRIKTNPCGVTARRDGKLLASVNDIRVGKYNVLKGESFEWKGVVKSLVTTDEYTVLVMTPNTKTSNMFDGEMYILEAQLDEATDVNILDNDIYKVVGFHGEAASAKEYNIMLHDRLGEPKGGNTRVVEVV